MSNNYFPPSLTGYFFGGGGHLDGCISGVGFYDLVLVVLSQWCCTTHQNPLLELDYHTYRWFQAAATAKIED